MYKKTVLTVLTLLSFSLSSYAMEQSTSYQVQVQKSVGDNTSNKATIAKTNLSMGNTEKYQYINNLNALDSDNVSLQLVSNGKGEQLKYNVTQKTTDFYKTITPDGLSIELPSVTTAKFEDTIELQQNQSLVIQGNNTTQYTIDVTTLK